MASIEVKLKRENRVYYPGEVVSGLLCVSSPGSKFTHNGITLSVEGLVSLQLSAKSVGHFDSFWKSLKPIHLLQLTLQVTPPGKLPVGTTELPFEFKLEPLTGQTLYETYHGVFVNVQYTINVDCPRPLLAKNLSTGLEFIIHNKTDPSTYTMPSEVAFTITRNSLRNLKKSVLARIPDFRVTGRLTSATCPIGRPFTGEVCVEKLDTPIRSIELQLVRVETCGCADGFAKEATEIQNIQIADGNITRGLIIPMFMVFPRLFVCPTLAARTFKVEFEVNLVILLKGGHLITENFPIRLVRT